MPKFVLSALLAIVLVLTAPGWTGHADPVKPLQAAFVRKGDLWLKLGGEETQITHGARAQTPKWSADGKFVAYAAGDRAGDIWVYSLESKRQLQVYSGGSHYEWAPEGHRLAFTIDSILNYADVRPEKVEPFRNVTGGTGNYSWLPDGSGFLVSSTASLLPNGWTSVQLFEVPVDAGMDPRKTKRLFTLPAQSDTFFAVGTSVFRWSPDGKWISFIAVPTASWSADSNTLCVLATDGKTFRQVDKMLRYPAWFRWAPDRNRLAFIAGEGRFAIHNKRLKIASFPADTPPSYTPEGYADRDFAWESERFITVSRSKEGEEGSGTVLKPLPALVRIDLRSNVQKPIREPPPQQGDYAPVWLPSHGKLAWVRSGGEQAEAWLARGDGSNASRAIAGIDAASFYYGAYAWDEVIAWYEPVAG
ncbi:TolB family protein [Paenibacillus hodogayensis]|uniref:TolB family protein n=1 Tax=Paenibacillus hodogayensis TaxID=279208 RepID=A0ABV5VWN2_9BACL